VRLRSDLDASGTHGRLEFNFIQHRFYTARDEQLLQLLPSGIATLRFPEGVTHPLRDLELDSVKATWEFQFK